MNSKKTIISNPRKYSSGNIKITQREAVVILWKVQDEFLKDSSFQPYNVLFPKSDILIQQKIENQILKDLSAITEVEVEKGIISQNFYDYWATKTTLKVRSYASVRQFANFKFNGSTELTEGFNELLLDSLCYYGYKKSFKEFREDTTCKVLCENDNITFLEINQNFNSFKPILEIIEPLKKLTLNDENRDISIKVFDIIKNRVKSILEDPKSNERIILSNIDYPLELVNSIKNSTDGFGINVPFNQESWLNDPAYQKISKINFTQNGQSDKLNKLEENEKYEPNVVGSYKYTRIMILKAASKDELSKDDINLIMHMLDHQVRIIVIFEKGFEELKSKIEKEKEKIISQLSHNYDEERINEMTSKLKIDVEPTETMAKFEERLLLEHKNKYNFDYDILSNINNLDVCILKENGSSHLIGTKFSGHFDDNKVTHENIGGIFYHKPTKVSNFFYKVIKPLLEYPDLAKWIFELELIETKGKTNIKFKSKNGTSISDLTARLERVIK